MIINSYYKDMEEVRLRKYHILRESYSLGQRLIRCGKQIIFLPSYGWKKVINNIIGSINPKTIIDYTLQYNFDHKEEIGYEFRRDKISRIAVYTAVFNGYDSIKEPLFISDDCDYYAITDQMLPENSAWKKIEIKDDSFALLDAYHKSKYCKLKPHVLFPNYEYSIWVDGNVQIIADMAPLVDRMDDNITIATFENPYHRCIYTEARYLLYYNAVNINQIHRQIKEYRKAGFPRNYGMREFSIIVRRHNAQELINIMETWWEHVNEYTMRDQISLPFILWKYGYDIDYIQLLGQNWRHNPRFIAQEHNWRIKFK